MKKAYRVKKEKEFSRVYHEGASVANRQFVLYHLPNDQSHFRLGLSVGKKIGNAVTRNYVKRRIRRSFQELADQLPKDRDIIVIARKPSAQMTMAEIKKSLIHVLRLAHLLNN